MVFIAVFGIVTLGLGWMLFWLVSPASIIWALVYYGASLGGPHSATIGMRMMDLELRTWYGAPGYFVLGAMHAVVFWVSVSFLSPADCCWSGCSTAAGVCCTISCSEPWLSTVLCAPRSRSRREPTDQAER